MRLRLAKLSSPSVGFSMDATPTDLEAVEAGGKLPPDALGAWGSGGSSMVLPLPVGGRCSAGDVVLGVLVTVRGP